MCVMHQRTVYKCAVASVSASDHRRRHGQMRSRIGRARASFQAVVSHPRQRALRRRRRRLPAEEIRRSEGIGEAVGAAQAAGVVGGG